MSNQSLVVYENNVLTEFIKIKNHSIKMSLLQIHASIILITVLLPKGQMIRKDKKKENTTASCILPIVQFLFTKSLFNRNQS